MRVRVHETRQDQRATGIQHIGVGGEQFDDRIAPLRFMDGYSADAKADYFTRRDYAAKWRNLSRSDVPSEWKGSQLSDTAYAAREVQDYLQRSLWPDEPSHLGGGQRKIYPGAGSELFHGKKAET